MISLILTIHNQAEIIEKVLSGLVSNISDNAKELIIIFDGCTDSSKDTVCAWFNGHDCKIPTIFMYADNVFETKANNMGLKQASQPYVIITQDDCVIKDYHFDVKLLEVMEKYSDVFAVSGRNAHDIMPNQYHEVVYVNNTGWGTEFNDPNTFYVRTVVNRGPLLLKMSVVKELNYLDEAFCPQNGDDHDLCIRASYRGYVCGCRPINFISDNDWGGTRKGNGRWIEEAIHKNMRIIYDRHLPTISVLHWDNFDNRSL